MNVQIEKIQNKISFIQEYEKRFWNKKKLERSLPFDALQDFTNDIQKLSGIQLEIKETPYATLS